MRVYISHASEDHETARSLFRLLKKDGFEPWLDEYSFGPGEWEPQIKPAIRSSRVFVFLISRASTGRDGKYNDEIKFALELDREDRASAPMIVPLRLDNSQRPTKLAAYLTYDLYSDRAQGTPSEVNTAGYDRFKEAISKLAPKTSRLVFSLHGIKTRGTWQKEITPLLAQAGFIPDPGDYGNVWALQLLWPRSRRKKVEQFKTHYIRECTRLNSERPSMVAHSYGTYIAGHAMWKYSEIKFDRIILCGAILRREFPWDALAKNGQLNAVLNQYGGQDFWARIVAWVVSDAGQSGRSGFSAEAACLTQQNYPRFRHSDYFYDLNYKGNWLPFLRGEAVASPPINDRIGPNWRFRAALILLLLVAALGFYFLRGCALFHSSASPLEWHIVDASAMPRPAYLQPLDRVLDDIDPPLMPQQQIDIDKLRHTAGSRPPVEWVLLLSSPMLVDKLPSRLSVPDGVSAEIATYVLDAGDGASRILTRPAKFGTSIDITKPTGSGPVYIAAFVFPLDRRAYEAIRADGFLQTAK